MTALEDEAIDIIQKAYSGAKSDHSLSNVLKSTTSQSLLDSIRSGADRSNEIWSKLHLDRRSLQKIFENPNIPELQLPDFCKQIIFPFGPYTVNGYVFKTGDNDCVLFDAGTRAYDYLTFLNQHNLTPSKLLITHDHSDHIGGTSELRKKFPKMKVLSSSNQSIQTGDILQESNYTLTAISCSGHSIDALAYFIQAKDQNFLISGDTIFARSVGKIPRNYLHSLQLIETRLLSLPEDTLILPGHGPVTTIADEKQHNPFFAKSL